MISKSEFADWRRSEVYQELWKDITTQMESAAGEIVNREDQNPMRDQLLKGYIKGLSTIMDWHPEFPPDPEEDQDADEV